MDACVLFSNHTYGHLTVFLCGFLRFKKLQQSIIIQGENNFCVAWLKRFSAFSSKNSFNRLQLTNVTAKNDAIAVDVTNQINKRMFSTKVGIKWPAIGHDFNSFGENRKFISKLLAFNGRKTIYSSGKKQKKSDCDPEGQMVWMNRSRCSVSQSKNWIEIPKPTAGWSQI